MLAAPFDAERGELTGTAVSVVQNVDPWNFAISKNGTLVYRPVTTTANAGTLVWVDREGRIAPAHSDTQEFARPRLSPDGSRVAVGIFPALDPSDIWVYDLIRGTRTRLTTSNTIDQDAIWTPDGSTILFSSNRSGASNLYQKPSDGSGDAVPFPSSDSDTEAHSISPDSKILAYYQRGRGTDRNRDIWTVPLDGQAEPQPFVATPFNERSPAFSPDGAYIAYVSDESGRDEIYVQPYPGPGRRVVVSRDGGREPVWSHDGTELFYRRGNEMWAAPVSLSGTIQVETPQKLFEGRFVAERTASGSQTYDVAADGRFILVQPTDQSNQLHVVVNWFEELNERVPTGR